MSVAVPRERSSASWFHRSTRGRDTVGWLAWRTSVCKLAKAPASRGIRMGKFCPLFPGASQFIIPFLTNRVEKWKQSECLE